MVEVKNLTKKFDNKKVLNKLCLSINKGSVYGLIGPNGAGKTTLIKHLAGIYIPNSGTIKIDDTSVFEHETIKRKVVYISDDLYFFPTYTIKDMAKFYSDIYPTWNWDRFNELEKIFQIDTKRRVTKLSKGMQKQVAFWLGISSMPEFLILDEPVDGLDPIMRRNVWNLILQDVSERSTTVLISSHNLRELEDVCDHVGILHNGKIVIDRSLDDAKSNIHKLQLAFSSGIDEKLLKSLDVLHNTQTGSINLLIVRGEREKIISKVQKYNPLFVDVLPLTLEEIFIYELGGMGYEIGNIII